MTTVFCLWLSLGGLTTSANGQDAGVAYGTERVAEKLASSSARVLLLARGASYLDVLSAGNPALSSAQDTVDEAIPNDLSTAVPTPRVERGSHQIVAEDTVAHAKKPLPLVEASGQSSPRHEPAHSEGVTEAAFAQPTLTPAEPQPVVLKSFEGRTSGADCTATLTWETASEQGSWAYEVQSSDDGQAFTALGTVPSKNRLTGATYTFRAGALPEARYFRLKLLDVGGASTYGPVVVLDAACTASKLLIAPNPARDQATVRGLPPGRSQALLYNATGQCVARASGEGSIALPLSELPAGVYLLKAVSESGAQAGSAKLVKE
jgi:hypothetical protein